MEKHATRDQEATVAFLMWPHAYGNATGPVERIDTHAAMVFLAGERAYKLKRAVKLPYLDFSTIEQRHEACLRELAINRRTAPDIYLDVIAIARSADGALQLGGEGEAVDWVVVMKRFPEEAVLDRLSVAGRLDPASMPQLARTIRRFHGEAERTADADWQPILAHIIETLEETLLGKVASPLGLDAAPILAALRQELQAKAPLLARRRREGYLRRCHGDLHLKNIVLLDGAPVLFDAIEFDETLAVMDVLYDLAFLLMDLWHRGARGEANTVLNVYFEGDSPGIAREGLALLPLFMSLRAAIRAMVGVHALAVTGEEARAATEKSVRDYTALARALLASRPPCLVAVGGLSGTGKTTVARGLAPAIGRAPGAMHLRSDVERKLMFGIPPTSRLPEEAYGADVSGRVDQRLLDKAGCILRTGHAVIVDAGFRRAELQEAVMRLAGETGVPLHGLWLQAPPEQLIARVEQRRNDASDAGREVVLAQLQAQAAPPPGWRVIDASGSPQETLARAMDACRPPA